MDKHDHDTREFAGPQRGNKWRTWIQMIAAGGFDLGAYIGINMLVQYWNRPILGELNCFQPPDDIARTICGRKSTFALDRNLAREYYVAREHAETEARAAIDRDHQDFIKRRAACFPVNTPVYIRDVLSCVSKAYDAAIATMRAHQVE